MTIGFRIRKSWTRVSHDAVEQFRNLPVANVSDCMSRMFAGGANLKRMDRDGVLAGPALTVKTRPGSNLLLHKAIEMAQPGDVIVVDGGGETSAAVMGEMMMLQAIQRGIAGFVINGVIRDADALMEINRPIFALGATHRGPHKDGPGEIGFAVSIGGIVIEAGDLLLGDGDGVLCVPRDQIEPIHLAALKKQEAEGRQIEQTLAGALDRSWIDRSLHELGCEFVEYCLKAGQAPIHRRRMISERQIE
ncbi:regulator of RNase E activity RraA [Rhizobium subbaraonis]|uniref:Putative 4-hydroxy-4-methyl-2-oxoglutarate aldolase n=1 Tax=Rhizobium subbaraonis TaxID=908946 RepID=A0A285UWW8_9HYPH|nr:RraA family protein [Rhizobium subbaraonis]SOC46319.1 regulator of RNase E activity RraA [Rhizobium subbaraonis]